MSTQPVLTVEELSVLDQLAHRPNRIDATLPCEWRYIHSRLPRLLAVYREWIAATPGDKDVKRRASQEAMDWAESQIPEIEAAKARGDKTRPFSDLKAEVEAKLSPTPQKPEPSPSVEEDTLLQRMADAVDDTYNGTKDASFEDSLQNVLRVVVEEIERLRATGADFSAIIDTLKHPWAPDRPSPSVEAREFIGVEGLVERLEKWLTTGASTDARGDEVDWTKPVREAAEALTKLAQERDRAEQSAEWWEARTAEVQAERDSLSAQVQTLREALERIDACKWDREIARKVLQDTE